MFKPFLLFKKPAPFKKKKKNFSGNKMQIIIEQNHQTKSLYPPFFLNYSFQAARLLLAHH